MIKNLIKEQLTIVSGGNSYYKYADGRIQVCITGNALEIFTYNSWGEALTHHRNLGSFTPLKSPKRG